MKSRPILFSSPMVRAILADQKTKTRRVVKFNEAGRVKMPGSPKNFHVHDPNVLLACPYGEPEDRLWVRETWADVNGESGPMITYRAGGGDRFLVDDCYPVNYSLYPGGKFAMWCTDLWKGEDGHSWRPSIFMPRWASRITLEVGSVSVERLNEISEEDCWKEGIAQVDGMFSSSDLCAMAKRIGCSHEDAKPLFALLWESINGPGSWDANPYVWGVEFKRVEGGLNE